MENPLELLKKTGNTQLINKIARLEKVSQPQKQQPSKAPLSSHQVKSSQVISDRSTHDNSDESDEDGIGDNDNESQQKDVQLDASFREKVVSYIKIDDSIRTKKAEILELKKKLKPCEDFIMQYLDSHVQEEDEKSVNVDNSIIAKQKTTTKGTLSIDTVKKSIGDGLRKAGFTDEAFIINIINTITEIIDANRKIQTKTKTSLKRKIKQPRKPRAKAPTKTKSTNSNKIKKEESVE